MNYLLQLIAFSKRRLAKPISANARTEDPAFSRLYSRLASLHPVGIAGSDRRRAATRQRYEEINGLLGIDGE